MGAKNRRKKLTWKAIALGLKLDVDSYKWRMKAAEADARATKKLREGDEDRHAEERGALQRRIDELERANDQTS